MVPAAMTIAGMPGNRANRAGNSLLKLDCPGPPLSVADGTLLYISGRSICLVEAVRLSTNVRRKYRARKSGVKKLRASSNESWKNRRETRQFQAIQQLQNRPARTGPNPRTQSRLIPMFRGKNDLNTEVKLTCAGWRRSSAAIGSTPSLFGQTPLTQA